MHVADNGHWNGYVDQGFTHIWLAQIRSDTIDQLQQLDTSIAVINGLVKLQVLVYEGTQIEPHPDDNNQMSRNE